MPGHPQVPQSGCRDHCGAGCAHLAQGKGLGTWSVLCSSHTIRVTPKGRADAENKAFSRTRVMRAMKPSLGPHVEAWSRVGSCLGLREPFGGRWFMVL